MFNDTYVKYLREKIAELTPSGYKAKVIKEVSYDATINEDDYTIICVVRFGVGSKRTNDVHTIIQPIILSVLTEARSVNVAQSIFNALFLSQSKVQHKLTIENKDYYIMPTLNSPFVQPNMQTISGAKRGMLFMTGVLSYSVNNVIGVKYYLKNASNQYEELIVINPSTQYSSNPLTPQYLNQNIAQTVLMEGSNNAFTLILPLMKNPILYSLLDVAINGGPKLQYDLKIEYPIDRVYERKVQVTSVGNNYMSESGDSTITVVFMPVN